MTNDRLTSTRDALQYLDQVKAHYSDRPWIYKEFLRILALFRSEQIDAAGVICRVFELFEGNKRLVMGFQTFLPDGCTVELPSSSDSDSKPMLRYQAVGCAESIVVEESGESSRVNVRGDEGTKVAARNEPLHDETLESSLDDPRVADVHLTENGGVSTSKAESSRDEQPLSPLGEEPKQTPVVDEPSLDTYDDESEEEKSHKAREESVASGEQQPLNGESKKPPPAENQCSDTLSAGSEKEDVASLEKEVSILSLHNKPVSENGADPTIDDQLDKTVDTTVASKGEQSERESQRTDDNQIPISDQRRHKEMLIRLFSNYSNEKLAQLDKETKSNAFIDVAAILGSSRKRLPGQSLGSQFANFRQLAGSKRGADSSGEAVKRRAGYAARSLAAVQEETRHASENPNTESFALQYNECSLAAISKWCGSDSAQRVVFPKIKRTQPIVDPKFRQCSQCGLWGHYECECTIKPTLSISHTGNEPVNHSDTYVVERFEDVIIEQRASKKHRNWSHKRTATHKYEQVCTTDIDGTLITAIARPAKNTKQVAGTLNPASASRRPAKKTKQVDGTLKPASASRRPTKLVDGAAITATTSKETSKAEQVDETQVTAIASV